MILDKFFLKYEWWGGRGAEVKLTALHSRKNYLQKPFLGLRYLNFCPDFFGHEGKQLDKKLRLILKFLTSSTGKQIITKLILPNISRSKGNQTMEFGQLIEIFLLKNYSKNKERDYFQTSGFFQKCFKWDKNKHSSPYIQYILVVVDLDIQ